MSAFCTFKRILSDLRLSSGSWDYIEVLGIAGETGVGPRNTRRRQRRKRAYKREWFSTRTGRNRVRMRCLCASMRVLWLVESCCV